MFPSMLTHCLLGDRKGIWPVKNRANFLLSFSLKQMEKESQWNHVVNQAHRKNGGGDGHYVFRISVFFLHETALSRSNLIQ